MATPIRWGVIGTGGIAHTFARDLRMIDDGVVVAVGSRTRATAESYGAEFGVARCYSSYEEVALDPEVDVVYVATPHTLHHDNAMLALDHGKPVLVEKAFTMSGAEARDLVDAARSRGLFLMEAMWTRFLPHVVAIRELLARGVLGEVVSVIADHGQWFEKNPEFRLFAPGLGGGALLDLGVYPVSFASMVLGTPHRVTAMIEPAFTGVDGLTSMIFGYESGAQAILTCTSLAKSATRASIVGTDARIDIEGDFYAPTSFTLVPRTTQAPERFTFATEGRGLHYEALEVARCLRAGLTESPIMPLDESVSVMETMERVLGLASEEAH
jgi:predicted dehydrogenase